MSKKKKKKERKKSEFIFDLHIWTVGILFFDLESVGFFSWCWRYSIDAPLRDFRKKKKKKIGVVLGKALAAADEVDSAELVNLPVFSKIEGCRWNWITSLVFLHGFSFEFYLFINWMIDSLIFKGFFSLEDGSLGLRVCLYVLIF